MMLLRDFLAANTLIQNTYNLFNYDTFATRLNVRFGKRVLRDDYTVEQIQTAAQNVVDINKSFFTAMSKQFINPFETWGETDIYTAGTSRTDTTTPNLTDVTTPDLTDSTTVNGTDTTQHRGTIGMQGSGDEKHFVNAYDNPTTPSPDNSATNSNTSTNTYNNDDTTTTDGNTVTTRQGTTSIKHTGTNTVEMVNSGTDETEKKGWNLRDYQLAMDVYLDFIDIIIDYVVKDILYITIRQGDI